MQKIQIIALGKIKEKFLQEAFAEYKKRLSGYCNLTVTEIQPEKLPENASELQIAKALDREADKIISAVKPHMFVVSMCIEGKLIDSRCLSKKIESAGINGQGVCFIIGSSFGLSEKVKQKSGLRFSMSPMTFPHDLARVMLSEQIYRAYKISEGSAYHK